MMRLEKEMEMGREIRSVPPDWEHPKDERGHHLPLHDETRLQRLWSIVRYDLGWYLKPKNWKRITEIGELWPDPTYCRPYWPKRKATAFQMYETVSEGTPVSPAFETLDELKDWLINQGYSEHAASEFCKHRWAPSMVMSSQGISMNLHAYDVLPETD
jgi:hypothetical protein